MSDFVDFNLAKKLKEKGFKFNKGYRLDRFFMGNEVNAPTISQVLKWLREEKNKFLEIRLDSRGYGIIVVNYIYDNQDLIIESYDINNTGCFYNSYEQAALAGTEYVLDNLI